MGGNAIKKTAPNPVSVQSSLIETVINQAMTAIETAVGDTEIQFLPMRTFKDKVSYGDLDFVVGLPSSVDVAKRHSIEEHLNEILSDSSYEIVRNGPVSSFAMELGNNEQFQIDLNYVDIADFECAYLYHGNGDLGNLLGRIFAGIGLKYRHTGLYYIHRNEDNIIGDILLTNDTQEIYNVIGLKMPDEPFETREDVFDFVTSSPFFHPSFFTFDNRNNHARQRDSNRPNYMAFLEYIDQKSYRVKPLAGKDFGMSMVFHFGKLAHLFNLMKAEAGRVLAKSVIDPVMIEQSTGLGGQDLGILMKSLRDDPVLAPERLLHLGFTDGRNTLHDILNPPF
jgi:hypothetical protein